MPIANPILSSLKSVWLALATIAITTTVTQAVSTPPPLQSMQLGWDAVPEAGISNYKVYVGTASQQYSRVLDAGTAISVAIGDLEYGQTYYFAVKAVGIAGIEGAPSNELVVTISPPPLPVGTSLTAAGTVTRSLSWTFPKSAMSSSPEFIVYQSTDLVNWTVAEIVLPAQYSSEDSLNVKFERPLNSSSPRIFYRITASNWLGKSVNP